ncbi:MAG: 50S ribosomal protein L23P [Candidatus Thorarchaeota archaeon AB_25]|nr:MAG: 50S ribosomal protein L23P [Candidatus Thorarchaeota archaeon AB_25]
MRDPNEIIIRPVVTEASLEAVDEENKLIFYVVRTANKNTIKWAVETLYDVVVEKVNTLIMPDGKKKALVRLAPEYSAAEVATNLGIF